MITATEIVCLRITVKAISIAGEDESSFQVDAEGFASRATTVSASAISMPSLRYLCNTVSLIRCPSPIASDVSIDNLDAVYEPRRGLLNESDNCLASNDPSPPTQPAHQPHILVLVEGQRSRPSCKAHRRCHRGTRRCLLVLAAIRSHEGGRW